MTYFTTVFRRICGRLSEDVLHEVISLAEEEIERRHKEFLAQMRLDEAAWPTEGR